MCGIVGYFSKDKNNPLEIFLQGAVKALGKRGPDFQKVMPLSPQVGFAHARLSIIDTSSIANQPMADIGKRYVIIFNGEIFNFRELKEQYLAHISFNTSSDTEVLLNLYALLGKDFLPLLNGFFSFAIFDRQTHEIFLARDRFGIKPLHIYSDEKMIVFASELKAIFKFPIKRELDYNTLALYLQLNYVPGTNSILKNVQKLKPGCYGIIDSGGNFKTHHYYSIPYTPGEKIPQTTADYDEAKTKLKKLVEEAVQRRLVSDVPLGTFLSGGVDSSVITACAAKHVSGLNTFSIGYKDEPYFDETRYANMVAQKLGTNHTVFPISNDEIFATLFSALDYIDEPFADSSALAVYVLSEKTRQKVTVSLSGDGGDELFAGYNKHKAEWNARKKNLLNFILRSGQPFLRHLPQSRHSGVTNLFRQLNRYSAGLQLKPSQRYWRWCTFNTQQYAFALIKNKSLINESEIEARQAWILDTIKETGDLNDVLFADMHLVLPGDMLTKVDLMSMANSLEVRVPLLDYNVVNYAFSLPAAFKISGGETKKIFKDAFKDDLPIEIFNRPKQGFEVPLLKWMRTGLRSIIENDLLSEAFIIQQNIFNYAEIELLKQKMFSANPGDAHASVWGLLVFQYWYKKYFQVNA